MYRINGRLFCTSSDHPTSFIRSTDRLAIDGGLIVLFPVGL